MSFPPAGSLAGKKKRVPIKGILIRSPVPTAPSTSSSESAIRRRVPGQYGSGPSILASERLALLVEEEPLVD